MIGKNIIPLIIIALSVFFIFKIKRFQFEKLFANKKDMDNVIDVNNIQHLKKFKKLFFTFLLVIFAAWLFFASIVIVEAGQTGIYSLFGKVKDKELSSGFHLVIPLARVTMMSVRTEEYTMSIAYGEGKKTGADAIQALTKEGLSVDLDMTVLYRLKEDKASDVYKELGVFYDEKIIRPAIRTSIRDIVAVYEAKDIYSEKRQEAADKIKENLKLKIEERGIVIEDVLLRNVNLPDRLTQSIQEKLQAEQEAEKYEFLLQKEVKEKERKIIEAEGQRDAQKIINESLSTNYLYYLYINELKEKEGTVYVPTSPSTGMPMFRNIGN